MEIIQVMVEPAVKKKIVEEAEHQGRPISNYCRELLKLALRERGFA